MAEKHSYIVCNWILDGDRKLFVEASNKFGAFLLEEQLQDAICVEKVRMVLRFFEKVFPALSASNISFRDDLCDEEVLSLSKTFYNHLFERGCKDRIIVAQLQLVVHDAFITDQFNFSLILGEWQDGVRTAHRVVIASDSVAM